MMKAVIHHILIMIFFTPVVLYSRKSPRSFSLTKAARDAKAYIN